MEPRSEGGAARPQREAQALGARRRRTRRAIRRRSAFRISAASQRSISRQRPGRATCCVRTVPVQRTRAGGEARGAGGHRVRPAGRQLRRGARPARRARRASFDDDTPYTPAWQERITGVPRDQVIAVARAVRRERAQDAGQVDGDHRRGDEPLVPQRHELPRRHQHADDVRLHRQERRRLGALRRPGEAAAADRLDRARLRARLDSPAAPDEQHQLLLRAHRPVALREARHGGGDLAARRQEARSAAA